MQNQIRPYIEKTQAPRLTLSLASTPEEIREVQRLRYQVFVESGNLSALSNAERLDQDAFDGFCDHLIVRDTDTLKVVGTYRLLSPDGARRAGSLYAEGEFDLSRLRHLKDRMVEAGRACIHPDFRGGSVLMLLWSGLADYMHRQRCTYLIGCASMSLHDGGHNAAAVFASLREKHMAPAEYRVTPHLPFPIHELASSQKPLVPPLIKGYLRSGAVICGEPAWDPDFESADIFLLLTLSKLDARYARHYAVE